MVHSRLLAVILPPLFVTALPVNPGPTLTIDSGPVIGLTTQVPSTPEDVSVNKFLGIPYAAPPARFSPPEPATPWSSPFNATAFGPACVQQFNYPEASRNVTIGFFNTPPVPESEDCLTLNIFAPAPALATSFSSSTTPSDHSGNWHDWNDASRPSDSGKAVMFWIHGGSLRFGTSRTVQYDGSFLAAYHDVIVVTINYRTNIFGFPGTDALALGSQNLGFLDQRFALAWVQRNIAHFGGDPAKVTIFGESAGSQSVDALITQPPLSPNHPLPFRAAIMQSGTASVRTSLPNYSAAWNSATLALNCSPPTNLSCMRALAATTIKDKIERLALNFVPVPDNVTLASDPRTQRLLSTAQTPRIARVPILIGSNADEGRLFSLGVSSLSNYLAATFLPNTTTTTQPTQQQQQLVSLLNTTYSATASTAFEQVANLITDATFQCPAALVARETMLQAAIVPVYRYYYNASFPNTQLFAHAGVYHASEIPCVFGTYPTQGTTPWQVQVAHEMMRIWAGFAKDPLRGSSLSSSSTSTTTTPSAGGDAWSGSDPDMVVGVLGGGVRAEDGPEGRGNGLLVEVRPARELDLRCAIWEAVYAAARAAGAAGGGGGGA